MLWIPFFVNCTYKCLLPFLFFFILFFPWSLLVNKSSYFNANLSTPSFMVNVFFVLFLSRQNPKVKRTFFCYFLILFFHLHLGQSRINFSFMMWVKVKFQFLKIRIFNHHSIIHKIDHTFSWCFTPPPFSIYT